MRDPRTKTLTHGQQIRTLQDQYEPVITVGTVRGYAAEYGDDPDAAEERARGFGHTLVWTSKHATWMTSDFRRKAERDSIWRRKHWAYVAAPVVEDGEIVEIEGNEYTVKYIGQQYADPVHFVPKGGTS